MDDPHAPDPTPLGPLLDTRQVMARYRLADPRAARALMRDAGAFRAGRGLLVRAEDLAAWEERRREAPGPLSRRGSTRTGGAGGPARAGGPVPVRGRRWWAEPREPEPGTG